MLRVTLKRSNINGEKLGAAFFYNFLNKECSIKTHSSYNFERSDQRLWKA